MAHQQAGAARLRSRIRQQNAVQLRVAGATYARIGEELGISRGHAHTLVTRALRETEKKVLETAEELRQLQLERLDALILALWPTRMNPATANTIATLMRDQRELAGFVTAAAKAAEAAAPRQLTVVYVNDWAGGPRPVDIVDGEEESPPQLPAP